MTEKKSSIEEEQAPPPSDEEQVSESGASVEAEAAVHPLQKLMDNPWLLLFLGILIPVLSYTVWGLVELLSIAPAKLP